MQRIVPCSKEKFPPLQEMGLLGHAAAASFVSEPMLRAGGDCEYICAELLSGKASGPIGSESYFDIDCLR